MIPIAENEDNDLQKGAVEDDQSDKNQTSMAGQLGHRDENAQLKKNDSDFPEPGGSPEHSGQHDGTERKQEAEPAAEPAVAKKSGPQAA